MKVSFFPKNKLGVWSTFLFGLLILLVSYFFLMVNVFDQTGGDTFFSNLNLTIPMLLAWLSGFVSFVLGFISIIKYEMKSMLVILIMVLTLFTSFYGIMEVLVTH